MIVVETDKTSWWIDDIVVNNNNPTLLKIKDSRVKTKNFCRRSRITTVLDSHDIRIFLLDRLRHLSRPHLTRETGVGVTQLDINPIRSSILSE